MSVGARLSRAAVEQRRRAVLRRVAAAPVEEMEAPCVSGADVEVIDVKATA